MKIRVVSSWEARAHGVQGPCARGSRAHGTPLGHGGPCARGLDPVGTGSSQPSLKPREEGRDGLGRSSLSRIYLRSRVLSHANNVYAMDLKENHFPTILTSKTDEGGGELYHQGPWRPEEGRRGGLAGEN